jgi:hypothetical protein
MSWPVAKNVSAPVGEAVTSGEAAVLPGDEAGTLGAADELAGATVVLEAEDEAEPDALAPCGVGPQAVSSRTRPASGAQAASCRGLAPFVVLTMSNPFNGQRLGELYHIYDAGRPAAVETRWRRAVTTIRSGQRSNSDGGSGPGRTYPKHWPSPR